MGKVGRKKKHDSRMARKRAEKAARKAVYLALAGTSKRNKRRRAVGGRTNFKHAHVMADCGNPGCQRCYPRRLTNAS